VYFIIYLSLLCFKLVCYLRRISFTLDLGDNLSPTWLR